MSFDRWLVSYLPEFLVPPGEAPEDEEGEVGRQLQPGEVPHQVPVHDGPVCVYTLWFLALHGQCTRLLS